MDLIARLRAELGQDAVLTGTDVTERSAGIWGPPRTIEAELLVRPRDTKEVATVLRLCHAAGQPVVTHGGLSNVVDSAHARRGDLVLSMERMRAIEHLDALDRTMTVQAGALLQRVQEAAEEQNLLFALDLGARGSATLGGNAATNAGGTQVIRYGMAREQILGLEAVLADGTIISSMNRMLKNNAGYDLKQLFIGSEGTLGVVTRLVLRLRQRPSTQATALVAVQSFEQVTRFLAFVDGALGGALTAFEVMWRDYYELVTTPPATSQPPLDYSQPYYILVESRGGDAQGDAIRFENVLEQAFEAQLLSDAVIAKSQAERDALWAIRDDVVILLNLKPMFLFDISLPIRAMTGYIDGLRADLQASWPHHGLYVFGHLGDGNLHIAVSAGAPDGSAHPAVEKIVYKPLQALQGSISAEHGIGLEKRDWLSTSRTEAEIALMRTLKRTLDPLGILNPGKVLK